MAAAAGLILIHANLRGARSGLPDPTPRPMVHQRLLRTVAWLLLPVAADAGCGEDLRFHYDCRVVEVEAAPRLAPEGKPAEIMRFTCAVRGGLLDGFVATGTNIWDGQLRDGRLLGSMVVASKGDSMLVYEVQEVTRKPVPRGNGERWEGGGSGVYKLATGVAAPLAGRSFHSVARSAGPGAFTLDIVVDD